MYTKTKYEISKKTSRGFYRIIAIYSNGTRLYVGGMHSRKFLYRTEELANAQIAILNQQEERIEMLITLTDFFESLDNGT